MKTPFLGLFLTLGLATPLMISCNVPEQTPPGQQPIDPVDPEPLDPTDPTEPGTDGSWMDDGDTEVDGTEDPALP